MVLTVRAMLAAEAEDERFDTKLCVIRHGV
jgi:hypothetical protein